MHSELSFLNLRYAAVRCTGTRNQCKIAAELMLKCSRIFTLNLASRQLMLAFKHELSQHVPDDFVGLITKPGFL